MRKVIEVFVNNIRRAAAYPFVLEELHRRQRLTEKQIRLNRRQRRNQKQQRRHFRRLAMAHQVPRIVFLVKNVT